MRIWRCLGTMLLAATIVGCAGGAEDPSGLPRSGEAAADRWLQAALARDDDSLRALSVDAEETRLFDMAERLWKQLPKVEHVSWKPSMTTRGDKAYTANIDGTIVTVDVKETGDGHWLVLQVGSSG